VQEALAAVLSAAAGHASPRDVPLHGALGLVLAEDVCAPDPLPPFRASVKVPSPPRLPLSLSTAPGADETCAGLSLLAGRVRGRGVRRAGGVPGGHGVEGRERRPRRGRCPGHGRLRHHGR
jgi:hypothetical protein